MFEIKSNFGDSHFFIRTEKGQPKFKYLHCDGRVIDVCEYFESREAAQAVLDKFYLEPEHEWKHGDVFTPGAGFAGPMIYMHYCTQNHKFSTCEHPRQDQVFSLGENIGGPAMNMDACMKGAKFLFNIKEKI